MCAQSKGGANEEASFESGHGDGALSVDAADGGEIWLGSGENTTQRICIGNANSSIEILGNVTINGKTWSV